MQNNNPCVVTVTFQNYFPTCILTLQYFCYNIYICKIGENSIYRGRIEPETIPILSSTWQPGGSLWG